MDKWTVDKHHKTMNRHSYKLQPYAGVQTRHTCPSCGGKRCFSLYIDEDGNPIADNVGRCDHESACGYHYSPSDYFKDHPDSKPATNDWRIHTYQPQRKTQPKPQPPLCTIPPTIVEQTIRPTIHSTLTQYLSTIIDPLILESLIHEYKLGVTKDRSIIYYQIDTKNRCRTGKIMKYDPVTGHRLKDPDTPSRITWAHSILKSRGQLPEDWQLTQCLFGEHLLPKYPDKKVALVESEKTAIICAALMPSYIWLATGGKSQLGDKLQILRGRNVIAFPNIDGYNEWKAKLTLIPGASIKVSDYLERNATDQDREAHIDIADLLLRNTGPHPQQQSGPTPNPILKYFSPEHHQELEALIQELDLIPVSIKKIS